MRNFNYSKNVTGRDKLPSTGNKVQLSFLGAKLEDLKKYPLQVRHHIRRLPQDEDVNTVVMIKKEGKPRDEKGKQDEGKNVKFLNYFTQVNTFVTRCMKLLEKL